MFKDLHSESDDYSDEHFEALGADDFEAAQDDASITAPDSGPGEKWQTLICGPMDELEAKYGPGLVNYTEVNEAERFTPQRVVNLAWAALKALIK